MPATKTTRACERCRQRKARCLPGSSSNACVSCELLGLSCNAHVPFKRGVKAQQTIEDLSRQVAALQLALYEQSKLLLSPQRADADAEQDIHTFGSILIVSLTSAGVVRDQCTELWMMRVEEVKEILHQYNNMAAAFPFSVIIDTVNPVVTLQDSTVLSLAALLVAPNSEPTIASQLDVAFHRVLSDQAMVQGKQNFDIFGGLVTYLLWFHHRYDPVTQQYFQYLQLAKAMSEDLEIGKCLESNASHISGISRITLARMQAGLYFIDQGTLRLDTVRVRAPLSVSVAYTAAEVLHSSTDRPSDVYAKSILDALCGSFASTYLDFDKQFDPVGYTHPSGCQCYDIVQCFSDVWRSLQILTATDLADSLSKQHCVATGAKLNGFIDLVSQQPPSYLQTMTIVEWAYLLAVLSKMPHLEGCVPDVLVGRTKTMVDSMTEYLLKGQAQNPRILTQAKHLWWLQGILADATSRMAAPHDLQVSRRLLATSTYELLEQLTERLTGFRKRVKVEDEPQAEHDDPAGDHEYDQILSQWVHTDTT